MTEQTNMDRLICGDNLEILTKLPENSVDLVYIDPPFFTNKNYEIIWNDGAEIRQFGDRWITENKNGTGRSKKDINVYLEWIEPRLKEIYRVLKDTGSFYLHCDYHADSYLRMLCDAIFNADPINIITWKRTNGKNLGKKRFPNITDTILFYAKSDNYTFKPINSSKVPTTIKEVKLDDDNNYYKWEALDCPDASGKKRFNWRGAIPAQGRGWAYKLEDLEKMLSEGTIRTKDGIPMMRGKKKIVNFDDFKIMVNNLWDDIPSISGGAKERLGYPTQKPEGLLERILKVSSNENDVVLDCFAGCGTCGAVANRLKRHFILIDVSPTACRLIAKRLGLPINFIEGIPITKEEIANLDGNEFQNWVIREFGGFSGKRGADGGVDGLLGECPIQVKKFKAGRNSLDGFIGTLLREKKEEAIFIAIEFSSDFKAEVARLKRENNIIIHHFDIKDVIERKHYPIVDKFIHKTNLDKYLPYETKQ